MRKQPSNSGGCFFLFPLLLFMAISQFISLTIEQLHHTGLLEMLAVFFGMLSVILASRNNVLLYPAGIISTGIYIWLMPSVKLYAEALLNGYYFGMSVYGWIVWSSRKNKHPEVPVAFSKQRHWVIALGIAAVGWIVFYLLLSRFTDSDVAVWDAFVSATACAGMWLLARHKVENWLWLNLSNAVAVPLLIHKGIPLTALLTVFLFIVAIFGYFRWKRIIRSRLAS